MMLQATTPAVIVQQAKEQPSTVILVIALLAEFIILFGLFAIYAPRIKLFLQDFPTHSAQVATALILILGFGIVVLNKLVLGHDIPESFDAFMWGMIALAGVNVGSMAVKRFSDYRYREIKNQTQEFRVPAENVEINVEAPRAPAKTPTPPVRQFDENEGRSPLPRAGDKPEDANVRAPLEDLASRQRAAAGEQEASD
jgi:hypothetical protein